MFSHYCSSIIPFKQSLKKPEFKHPENGKISVVNKKGDSFEINYENGKIKSVYKNGDFYKAYFYNRGIIPVLQAARHKFSDGTQLDEDQFYPLEKNGESVTVYLGNDVETNIYKNNNPIYKDEPVFRINQKIKGKEARNFEIVKSDGVAKAEFKSLDEASEYFMKEYGIDAEFINLKQAFLMKEAVDDFVKIDYESKGKKLFEGLKIRNKEADFFGELAEMHIDYDFGRTNGDVESFNLKDLKDFSKTLPEYDIKMSNLTINFNTLFDWDNAEEVFREGLITELHKNVDLKSNISHELIHCLHLLNAPREYIIFNSVPFFSSSEEEKEIMREVSKYAQCNFCEFVAEYGMGKLSGKTYSKEVDKLYEECCGPVLAN